MTESEWLASEGPAAMLSSLLAEERDGGHMGLYDVPRQVPLISARKLRLFSVACCRAMWPLLTDERSRKAVEMAERYADGEATEDELQRVDREADEAAYRHDPGPQTSGRWACAWVAHADLSERGSRGTPPEAALWYCREAGMPPAAQAILLRAIVGNPFRPMALALPCPWLTPQVASLALAAYEERDAITGHLDTFRLALLADALEEAGCTEEAILRHLRGWRPCKACPRENYRHHAKCICKAGGGWIRQLEGPHVRGCWAIDLIREGLTSCHA